MRSYFPRLSLRPIAPATVVAPHEDPAFVTFWQVDLDGLVDALGLTD